MAPLFPTRHAPLRARLLLVIHLLPLPIPPSLTHILHRPPPWTAELLPALQPVNPLMHVVSLARILAIVSDRSDSSDYASVLCGLRVPILDGDRTTPGMFSVRRELSGRVVGL